MHRLALLALVGGSLVTLSGHINQANASGVFPGSQCQSASNHDNYRLNLSRVQNASTSATLVADCPVPQLDTGGTIGAGITVRDRSSTANVTCSYFGVQSDTAGNFGFVQTLSSSGNSTTPQSLSYSSLSVHLNLYYFIGCQLPPVGSARSEIISYGSVTFN